MRTLKYLKPSVVALWVRHLVVIALIAVLAGGVYFWQQPKQVQAAAGPQIFMAETSGASESGATLTIQGSILSKNDGGVMTTFPVAGTLSHLRYARDFAPGGAITITATIQVNKAATALACTVASGDTSCSDDTDVINVAVGDNVLLNTTRSGVPVGQAKSFSMVFTPTTSGETVFFAASPNNGTFATTSFPWMGATSQPTEANAQQVFPEAGVLDRFFASSTSIVSGSIDYFVFQNAATSSLTCTIGTPSFRFCSDTTNTLTIATGDTFSLRQSPSASALAKGAFGVRFVPTTAGNFDLFYTTQNGFDGTVGTVHYLPIAGSRVSNTAVEASTTAIVAAATTFTSMTVLRTAGPGAAKNITYSLRVNSATSSLACTLTGSGTGAGISTNTCTGSVSVVAGDLIDWSAALDAAGTTGSVRIGLVANANTADAGGTSPVDNSSAWFEIMVRGNQPPIALGRRVRLKA